MPGTVVLVHHDLVVVIDPDVLIRRSVVAALNGLGFYGLAYGGWRDAARQLARIAPKLRAMPLPASINSFDCLDLWQRLSLVLGTSHRSLSVLPVTSMPVQRQGSLVCPLILFNLWRDNCVRRFMFAAAVSNRRVLMVSRPFLWPKIVFFRWFVRARATNELLLSSVCRSAPWRATCTACSASWR